MNGIALAGAAAGTVAAGIALLSLAVAFPPAPQPAAPPAPAAIALTEEQVPDQPPRAGWPTDPAASDQATDRTGLDLPEIALVDRTRPGIDATLPQPPAGSTAPPGPDLSRAPQELAEPQSDIRDPDTELLPDGPALSDPQPHATLPQGPLAPAQNNRLASPPQPDRSVPDLAEEDMSRPGDMPGADAPFDEATIPDTESLPIDRAEPDLPQPEVTQAPARIIRPEESRPALPGSPVTGLPGQAGRDASASAEARPPARLRNAIPVDLPAAAPRMGVILNDAGLPRPMREALAARDLTFIVALNPLDPSAAQGAEIYRAGGKEVVLLASNIPDRATPADIEVTFGAFFDALPDAVAVLDLPRDGFTRNTRLFAEVLPIIARDGHGLLTFAGGLGQPARQAEAAGVAHAEIARVLDAGDEGAITIRRFLDRAVFQAIQTGQVIVFGEASNDTMLDALDLWLREGRARDVALAPVSALLSGGMD